MSSVQDIWHSKTDEEILDAATCLDEYAEEARQAILTEAKHRDLNVAPLIEATAKIQGTPKKTGFTSRCAYCDTRIFFGGKREGDLLFCGEECRSLGILLTVSHRVPDSTVNEQLWSLHRGNCPQCGGPGPVDVHTSHRVWSAVVLTSWSNKPRISCTTCGNKARIKDSIFSLMFGWWGFPWGPVMTLLQILRNMSKLFHRSAVSEPSEQLERLIRLRLAAEIVSPPLNQSRPFQEM